MHGPVGERSILVRAGGRARAPGRAAGHGRHAGRERALPGSARRAAVSSPRGMTPAAPLTQPVPRRPVVPTRIPAGDLARRSAGDERLRPHRSGPKGRAPETPTRRTVLVSLFSRSTQMMIVMKPTATEEDIQAVIDRIESCGARAHPSRGEEVTVIGAIGDREHVQRLGLEGHPGVEQVVPILRPYKLSSNQFRSWRAHRHRDRRATDRRRALLDDRRAVHGRVARPDALDRAHRGRGRRVDVPRRRLQAALLAVQLPGPRSGGPAAAGRGQGADRPADRHRADGRARRRADPRGRRRDPGRRAQHAELPAAGRDRPHGQAGADQARPLQRRSRSC